MRMPATDKALIIQSDHSLLLDVHSEDYPSARDSIAPFAELIKSPEHIHTYRISPLSLWNAASSGLSPEEIRNRLSLHARYPAPDNVLAYITETISKFGKIRLLETDDPLRLILKVEDPYIFAEIEASKRLSKILVPHEDGFSVSLYNRGVIKQELIRIGYPVKDEAPLEEGEHLDIGFRNETSLGNLFTIRDYQVEAAAAFNGDGNRGTGYGTIVLPCGAGKTIVGMKVMELLQTNTLIITTNVAAVHQWMDELVDKTSLSPDLIGEYTGDKKEIKPVTVSTYQILVWRRSVDEEYPHFMIFRERSWGLIIYDEVHLLPAPVFRVTAEIQATRRLGLTATLVREDGREEEVFTLIGPKRYDVPWKEMEAKGWIAEANCYEVRIDLPDNLKIPYAIADKRQKFRIASENPLKNKIVSQIIDNHREDSILVIGQYINQLKLLSKELGAPLITGATPNPEREQIYNSFRKGEVKVIVVSKVANFAIDLPDASVAIQVSGTFGSRQEEAQRLGRILRPKERNSFFYTLISRYTTEETFGANRQKFLTEQGYKYHIEVITEQELG
jgi:DNA excision repair protein ERCC-3